MLGWSKRRKSRPWWKFAPMHETILVAEEILVHSRSCWCHVEAEGTSARFGVVINKPPKDA